MIVGRSPAIVRAKTLVERYARTRMPILLVGETGTGKEVFAQYIHDCSNRSGPFVDVNCGALPREMVESLLFGHRRGAFTGAIESVQGYIERSSGGTLFLDELTALFVEGQAKLLRALEASAVQALGSAGKIRVDLRIVSAVPTGILQEMEAGRFRRDLYQRVAGVVVELPPLTARMEDLLPLAEHFAALQGQRLEAAAAPVLLNYSWPGNVRELRLAIERAGQVVEDGVLPASAVAEGIALGAPASEIGQPGRRQSAATPRRRELRDTEQLLRTCEGVSWNIPEAARSLGVSRASLYRRLRRLGIQPGSGSRSHSE